MRAFAQLRAGMVNVSCESAMLGHVLLSHVQLSHVLLSQVQPGHVLLSHVLLSHVQPAGQIYCESLCLVQPRAGIHA